jgi:hypothetical protein
MRSSFQPADLIMQHVIIVKKITNHSKSLLLGVHKPHVQRSSGKLAEKYSRNSCGYAQ